ncbi:hypothetical protein L484_005343 [Morus notabilis]|uniref:Uncharacterized protein n=1 Tax=Morus notabilis TaxID=981085 RepID=W9QUW0_9ROSA|nr:hypothetical protein L484_005343 [Morus notabilis]
MSNVDAILKDKSPIKDNDSDILVENDEVLGDYVEEDMDDYEDYNDINEWGDIQDISSDDE